MTIVDAVTHFHTYLLTEQRVSLNTFDAYKRDLDKFVVYATHEACITIEECGSLLKPFLKTLRKSGLSARTVSRAISCLRTFFSYLEKKFEINNSAVSLVTPRLEHTLPQFLTEKEITILLEKASEDMTETGQRNSVMLHVLYATGLRISELLMLQIDTIHFSEGLLRIKGKSGKERIVPLPGQILTLLSYYLDTVFPIFLYKDGQKRTTPWLFPTYYDQELKAMTRQCFWLYLKKIAKEASIKSELSPHMLRHSLATHLLKNGANLRSLQMLLGHEQLRTVEIYTHLETSHLRRIYDAKHPRS